MAQYKTDLRDLYFNLFEHFKVQDFIEGYEIGDLKEIINQFDKFIEKEIYPTREVGDVEGVKLTEQGVTVPAAFHKANQEYYQNGWFALGYPEEIGGMPAPHAISFSCISLFVGANTAFSMYPELSKGAMNVILKKGSDEQQQQFVAPMMEGRWGGTMCLTEPGAGSDIGAVKTTATPNSDGSYKINGVKIFISSGDNDLFENIIHLVLARTPGAPEGTKGLSLFIVPKFKINEDGSKGDSNFVKCTKIEEKMGIHGSATCELTFGGDGEAQGFLIGEEFEGMANMFIMMNEARLLCGIQGESQANLAFQLSKQYIKERSQFGTTIENLPDVKRLMLKMRAMTRGMRSLILYTATLFDKHQHGDEGAMEEIALLTPICKAYCSEEGFNVCVDAIQVHGGYGFCTEYGIEQFARDTKIATIYEGTNGIQAIDFVMRKILKDEGAAFLRLAGKVQKTMARESASDFKAELLMMGKSMEKAQAILEQYGKFAKTKQFDSILSSCTDFMMYSGNLIISWLLLDAACDAKESLAAATGDDKEYYESKITDFKIFSQHFLTRNSGLAQSILQFEQNLSNLNL